MTKNIDPMAPERGAFLGFTSAALRADYVRTMAGQFLGEGDWSAVRKSVLEENLLQTASRASLIRLEREFRQRAQHLTLDQLRLAAEGTSDEGRSMAWLAAAKRYAFLRDFAVGLLREKLESWDTTLRRSDYESYWASYCTKHPDAEKVSESSRRKVQSRLLTMLREAGILARQGSDLGEIRRPDLPPDCRTAILRENAGWLAAFLYSDAEILKLRGSP